MRNHNCFFAKAIVSIVAPALGFVQMDVMLEPEAGNTIFSEKTVPFAASVRKVVSIQHCELSGKKWIVNRYWQMLFANSHFM